MPEVIGFYLSPSPEVMLTLTEGVDTTCFSPTVGIWGSSKCYVSDKILFISLPSSLMLCSLLFLPVNPPLNGTATAKWHISSRTGGHPSWALGPRPYCRLRLTCLYLPFETQSAINCLQLVMVTYGLSTKYSFCIHYTVDPLANRLTCLLLRFMDSAYFWAWKH